MPMTLQELGWHADREEAFARHRGAGFVPARVAAQHRDAWDLLTEAGSMRGVVTGRMHFESGGPGDLPAVGDWVAARPLPGEPTAVIEEVLPRTSCFMRRAAGSEHTEQVIAANVDRLFLVSGLDGEFNRRRVERYLAAAAESGAEPVLVLNKVDACEDPEAMLEEARAAAGEGVILLLSATSGEGIEGLREMLGPGVTGALAGSSGVGKTTIVNALVGRAVGETAEVRESDRHGRHTTVRRELVPLPSGGLLIDTPGMREMGMWGGTDGVDSAFSDVTALAADCRFRDCTHQHEPGCAVRGAVETGELDPDRLFSYLKLRKEAARQGRLLDKRAAAEQEKRNARLLAFYRRDMKRRKKR